MNLQPWVDLFGSETHVTLRMMMLREILAAHRAVLLLDAASSVVQVAWLEADKPPKWHCGDADAGIGIFSSIDSLGIELGQANAFVFCEGPGSVLGTRTVAMAIRTWCVLKPRPVFAFSSLALVAHALARPEVSVIVDARRDSWHCYRMGRGLERVPAKDLPPASELVTPEQFRHWSPLPAGVTTVSYSLPDLLERASNAALFRPTDSPDAFLHEEPSYVTWTPKIHRAPASR